MKILITGCAGFIGHHLSKKILNKKKFTIIGIDNLDKRFDFKLKLDRLADLSKHSNFKFYKQNINSYKKNNEIFKNHKIDCVIHLAAKAGVRYSIYNPKLYVQTNIDGFFNILDLSYKNNVNHFIFASSSSVYGKSSKFPQTESDITDKPESFYAATKKSNELMAHAYSSIHKFPCTGLRFFTVYGNYVRQDMALHKFTSAIYNKKSINLFNNGKHYRDFTHVSDIIKIIEKLITKPSKKAIPYQIMNIGGSKPSSLKSFVDYIEKSLKIKANINRTNLQKGDVVKTHADTKRLRKIIKVHQFVKLNKGIDNFVRWYINYYKK